MLCENKLTNLVFKNQDSAKTQFASFSFLYIYTYIYKMHECYAMQILETKRKKGKMVTKGKAMKHKDNVRKTQLGRVFCIQNLLDTPRALEFVFTLE